MAAAGTVAPPLSPAYAFDDAATALQDIADRRVHGEVVVTLSRAAARPRRATGRGSTTVARC